MTNWPCQFLVFLVRGYQWFVSPLLGQSCRFTPTCSQYAVEALQTHGAIIGMWLTLRRVLRCHPMHPGGHDPVPLISTERTCTETVLASLQQVPTATSEISEDVAPTNNALVLRYKKIQNEI